MCVYRFAVALTWRAFRFLPSIAAHNVMVMHQSELISFVSFIPCTARTPDINSRMMQLMPDIASADVSNPYAGAGNPIKEISR